MSLLPEFVLEDEIEEEEVEDIEEIPQEYGIDFATGQLTGEIVEGKEAIKVWIWLALNVPRYRHIINTWEYGNEIETLIGKGYSQEHLDSEVKYMIEDALSPNDYITEITNLDASLDGDKLTVSLTVETPYGEVEIDV